MDYTVISDTISDMTQNLTLLPSETLDIIASNLCNQDLLSLLMVLSHNEVCYSKIFVLDNLLVKTGAEFIVMLSFNKDKKYMVVARSVLYRLGWRIEKLVKKSFTRTSYDICLRHINDSKNCVLQNLYLSPDYIYFQLEVRRFGNKNKYKCSSNYFVYKYTSQLKLIFTIWRHKKHLQMGDKFVPSIINKYFDLHDNLSMTFIDQTYSEYIIPNIMSASFDNGKKSLYYYLIEPFKSSLNFITCDKVTCDEISPIFINCFANYKQYSRAGKLVKECQHLPPVNVTTAITNFNNAQLHEVIHLVYHSEHVTCRRCYYLTSTLQDHDTQQILYLPLMYWGKKWQHANICYDYYFTFDGSVITTNRIDIFSHYFIFDLFYTDDEKQYIGPITVTTTATATTTTATTFKSNDIPNSMFFERFM
jgi:hypothetical protein